MGRRRNSEHVTAQASIRSPDTRSCCSARRERTLVVKDGAVDDQRVAISGAAVFEERVMSADLPPKCWSRRRHCWSSVPSSAQRPYSGQTCSASTSSDGSYSGLHGPLSNGFLGVCAMLRTVEASMYMLGPQCHCDWAGLLCHAVLYCAQTAVVPAAVPRPRGAPHRRVPPRYRRR